MMLRAAFPKYVWWSSSLINVNKCFREKKRLQWLNVENARKSKGQ